MSVEADVLAAAEQRAPALVARDADELLRLMHPRLRWTTHDGIVVDEVERDGRPETFRLRLTQVWVREDERWQCLAGHAGPAP